MPIQTANFLMSPQLFICPHQLSSVNLCFPFKALLYEHSPATGQGEVESLAFFSLNSAIV
jgi:hypothetical protein